MNHSMEYIAVIKKDREALYVLIENGLENKRKKFSKSTNIYYLYIKEVGI